MTRRHALRLTLASLFTLALLTAGGCGALFGGSSGSDSSGSVASSGGAAELFLLNNSNQPIHHVYMSSSAQRTWGPDQLGSRVLQRGARFQLTGITAGVWDIRVVDSTGNSKEFYQQRVQAGRSYTLAIDSTGWTLAR